MYGYNLSKCNMQRCRWGDIVNRLKIVKSASVLYIYKDLLLMHDKVQQSEVRLLFHIFIGIKK